MPVKISQLPAASALDGTEALPLVQASATKKGLVSQIATYVQSLFSVSGGSALIGFIQAGTGAVARTEQAKLRDVLSVKDFGAVGDGIVDDTVAIQAALDALFAANGGCAFLPRGTYKVTAMLQVKPRCGIAGEGVGSLINFVPAAAATAIRLGVKPSASVNIGMFLRELKIQLSTANCVGVEIVAGVSGSYTDVVVAAATINTSQTGWILDGSNISGYLNTLLNCTADHCNIGFHSTTSGSTGVTENHFINCSVFGDYPTDGASVGFYFENCGESSTLIGGNMEACFQGILQTGACNTAAFTWISPRFEANGTDLQMNATGGAAGQVVILGGSTLDPAKTNDNSGHRRNVIQYGAAGTVGITGQDVVAGYTTVNGAQDGNFTATVSGAVAGTFTCKFSVAGQRMKVILPQFKPAGNSSATPITITGIPTGLQPTANITEIKVRVTDNGAYLNAPGMVRAETTNSLTIFATAAGGSFTSSANSTGWDSFEMDWAIA